MFDDYRDVEAVIAKSVVIGGNNTSNGYADLRLTENHEVFYVEVIEDRINHDVIGYAGGEILEYSEACRLFDLIGDPLPTITDRINRAVNQYGLEFKNYWYHAFGISTELIELALENRANQDWSDVEDRAMAPM